MPLPRNLRRTVRVRIAHSGRSFGIQPRLRPGRRDERGRLRVPTRSGGQAEGRLSAELKCVVVACISWRICHRREIGRREIDWFAGRNGLAYLVSGTISPERAHIARHRRPERRMWPLPAPSHDRQKPASEAAAHLAYQSQAAPNSSGVPRGRGRISTLGRRTTEVTGGAGGSSDGTQGIVGQVGGAERPLACPRIQANRSNLAAVPAASRARHAPGACGQSASEPAFAAVRSPLPSWTEHACPVSAWGAAARTPLPQLLQPGQAGCRR
jgi:hypothetical protein